MKILRCILKKGKEKPFEGFHPWVFSGAIDRIEEGFEAGDLVKVFSAGEKFLGTGYLNPRSQIAIRMLAFEDAVIDTAFFEKKIAAAVRLREGLAEEGTNAYRVIHSEGDSLAGLVVDRYGDYLVAQFQTAGIDQWRETITGVLQKVIPCRGIFERDDSEWRSWEGLESRVGKLAGEEPPDYVEILENGIPFLVDIHTGQKTGFFLDQRDNRKLAGRLARGRRVLNCFAYTGAFSIYAAKGGAVETVSVESSERAMNLCRENFKRNGFDAEAGGAAGSRFLFEQADVFDYLRRADERFDFIILDPPAFCKNRHQVQQAARGYKDINLYALKRLRAGGLLFTFSCSSYIPPELFQKIVFAAAKDARRDVRIIAKTAHPLDHPVNIFHPEGEYLKGMLCAVN